MVSVYDLLKQYSGVLVEKDPIYQTDVVYISQEDFKRFNSEVSGSVSLQFLDIIDRYGGSMTRFQLETEANKVKSTNPYLWLKLIPVITLDPRQVYEKQQQAIQKGIAELEQIKKQAEQLESFPVIGQIGSFLFGEPSSIPEQQIQAWKSYLDQQEQLIVKLLEGQITKEQALQQQFQTTETAKSQGLFTTPQIAPSGLQNTLEGAAQGTGDFFGGLADFTKVLLLAVIAIGAFMLLKDR